MGLMFGMYVFGGGHIELFLKISCKIALGAEPNHIGYFIDTVFAGCQQFCRPFEAGYIDQLDGGKVGERLYLAI